MATLSPRPASTWRSTQLYARVELAADEPLGERRVGPVEGLVEVLGPREILPRLVGPERPRGRRSPASYSVGLAVGLRGELLARAGTCGPRETGSTGFRSPAFRSPQDSSRSAAGYDATQQCCPPRFKTSHRSGVVRRCCCGEWSSCGAAPSRGHRTARSGRSMRQVCDPSPIGIPASLWFSSPEMGDVDDQTAAAARAVEGEDLERQPGADTEGERGVALEGSRPTRPDGRCGSRSRRPARWGC